MSWTRLASAWVWQVRAISCAAMRFGIAASPPGGQAGAVGKAGGVDVLLPGKAHRMPGVGGDHRQPQRGQDQVVGLALVCGAAADNSLVAVLGGMVGQDAQHAGRSRTVGVVDGIDGIGQGGHRIRKDGDAARRGRAEQPDAPDARLCAAAGGHQAGGHARRKAIQLVSVQAGGGKLPAALQQPAGQGEIGGGTLQQRGVAIAGRQHLGAVLVQVSMVKGIVKLSTLSAASGYLQSRVWGAVASRIRSPEGSRTPSRLAGSLEQWMRST